MLMFPQRWQVGRTLSHLTFAREQASHEALIFLGLGFPSGPRGSVALEGRDSMVSVGGDGGDSGVV